MGSFTAVADLDVTGPTISRHLYGHFAEHLGRCIYGGFWVGEDSPIPNIGGIRQDVVEALRALDIPNLRWPGGCFADNYHWRNGIGPRESRPRTINLLWGGVEENNHFGTHEFLHLTELLGAEPYVNGNVGSGTVHEMADWVEYLTRDGDSPLVRERRRNGREKPWRIPFWGIGNEPWGCGGNMSAKWYAELARQFATFLPNYDGNTLTRIAAGADEDDLRWTEALMQAVSLLGEPNDRPVFQAISFHFYTHSGEGLSKAPATEFSGEQYYATLSRALDIERVIKGHIAVMDAYDPERRMGLVCDEWGTWWRVEEGTNPGFLYQQNTLRDALVAGVHFDIFHRHAERLRMANIAQTIDVLQSMLLTDDDGHLVLTPTYHVFEMNKGHQDAQRIATHLVHDPALDPERGVSLSASAKDDKALISLTNLNLTDPADVSIEFRGGRFEVGRARVLSADGPAAYNDVANPAAVAPSDLGTQRSGTTVTLTLPPHSFATVELNLM